MALIGRDTPGADLVIRGARVLDPKRSLRHHVRTDFGRVKPKWFIPIVDAQRISGVAPKAAG